jgi:hypothetical protein
MRLQQQRLLRYQLVLLTGGRILVVVATRPMELILPVFVGGLARVFSS